VENDKTEFKPLVTPPMQTAYNQSLAFAYTSVNRMALKNNKTGFEAPACM
jgi:hypothetical protein